MFGALRYFLILTVALAALAVMIGGKAALRFRPEGFALGMPALFFTDWLSRGYNFFQGPNIRGEILLLGLLGTWLIIRLGRLSLTILPWLTSLVCFYAFFHEAQGRLLFSDDHASFQFRLQSLKDNFPVIPFYHPLWNGGMDARDFFATGALSSFLIFSPLIYLFQLVDIYNLLVTALLFVVTPLCMHRAAKTLDFSAEAAAIAATLSMTTGLIWYRWALKYGTLGFITSCALLPLAYVLMSKALSPTVSSSRGERIFCLVVFSLMLLWSLSGLSFVPLFLAALFFTRSLLRKRGTLGLGAAILAVNLPWIFLFLSVSRVGSFVTSEAGPAAHTAQAEGSETTQTPTPPQAGKTNFRHKSGSFDLTKSLAVLRDKALSTNPLLLFFLIPGIILLPRWIRWQFSGTALWLLLLGTVAVPLKPQLELDRMLVMLFALGALPAAAALSQFISTSLLRAEGISPRWQRSLLAPCCVGFLFTGPFSTANILQNGSLDQYYFADQQVETFTAALRDEPGSGRILFSGFVLHELGEGHLAPLVYWTNKPLMASSQFHNLWRYQQIIPEEFLARGDEGIKEYFDLYNVQTIIAHEHYWKNYFLERPELYMPVSKEGRFWIFRRRIFPDSYFLEGAGEITRQDPQRIVFRLRGSEAVLKFNFFPFLKATSPCIIAPRQVGQSVTFIALHECPIDQELEIKAAAPWTRVLP